MVNLACFDRNRLQPAGSYYLNELGGKLTRANSKGWALGRCPFHPSKSGKSFSVNVQSGSFHCFGCGVSGGDLIDYVRLRDHCSFVDAAKRLGCWRETGTSTPRVPVPTRLVPYLVLHFTISGKQYRVERQDEPKSDLQRARWFYAEAADRLGAIWRAGAEKYQGEADEQWGNLANSWELVQRELAHGE